MWGLYLPPQMRGKTEIASGIMQQLLPYLEPDEHIIFFVPSKQIFYGAHERLEQRLGVKVGQIGDGKRKIRQVNVVMVPSMVSALKDPTKEVKISAKDRPLQIMVQEILPVFKGKTNVKHLLENFIRGYKDTTKAREIAKQHLVQIATNTKSDAQVKMELNKLQVAYDKLMKRLASKKYGKWQETLDLVDKTAVVICDEAHHAGAQTWYDTIMKFSNAQYRIGMTGTIEYKDKILWQRLQALFSGVIARTTNEQLISRGFSAKPTLFMSTIKQSSVNVKTSNNYMEAYSGGIVNNKFRNDIIVNFAGAMYNNDKTTLIITNRVDQGDLIFEGIKALGIKAEFIQGKLNTETRLRQLEDIRTGKLKILIATNVLDEGLDISGINCLIMTAGGKSLKQTLQRVGRILRRKEGDNTAMVFDFIDRTNKYLLRHSEERIKIYKGEGFEIKYLN